MANLYNNPGIEKAMNEGYNLNFGDYFNKAWNLVKSNLGLYVGFTIVYLLIITIVGLIPILGTFANLVLAPALLAGFYSVNDKLSKGQSANFNNFFDGFSMTGNLFLVYLVMILFVIGGLILLILPGIYLAIAYTFAIPLTWFCYNGSILDTLETSRRLITKKWWSFFGFYLLCGLVALLGFICLGVGIFVAVPVIYAAQYFLYADVTGSTGTSAGDPFNQLVDKQEI